MRSTETDNIYILYPSFVGAGYPDTLLVEFLRRRNDFAHPNFLTPDVDLTKGYIAELLSVITSPPFPKPTGT